MDLYLLSTTRLHGVVLNYSQGRFYVYTVFQFECCSFHVFTAKLLVVA